MSLDSATMSGWGLCVGWFMVVITLIHTHTHTRSHTYLLTCRQDKWRLLLCVVGQVLGESGSPELVHSDNDVCVCVRARGCFVWAEEEEEELWAQIAVSCLIVRVIMKYCLIYGLLESCVILMNRTFYFFIPLLSGGLVSCAAVCWQPCVSASPAALEWVCVCVSAADIHGGRVVTHFSEAKCLFYSAIVKLLLFSSSHFKRNIETALWISVHVYYHKLQWVTNCFIWMYIVSNCLYVKLLDANDPSHRSESNLQMPKKWKQKWVFESHFMLSVMSFHACVKEARAVKSLKKQN